MQKLIMNRDDAWALLTEYTKSDRLLKHAMAVEAAVRGYARKFGEDEDAWGITALLHDFDYERWPALGDHPNKGSEILHEKGYPDWMIRASPSHAKENREEHPIRIRLLVDDQASFVRMIAERSEEHTTAIHSR